MGNFLPTHLTLQSNILKKRGDDKYDCDMINKSLIKIYRMIIMSSRA